MAGKHKEEFPPLLPVGFHPKSLTEVRSLCVNGFPHSLTRASIMDGLEYVIGQLNSTGVPMEVWVDGSFMTEKLNPKDSDIAVRIMAPDYATATQQSRTIIKWVSDIDLTPAFKCDSYVFSEFPPSHKLFDQGQWNRAYWLNKFGFSRAEEPKGLAVVKLPFVIT